MEVLIIFARGQKGESMSDLTNNHEKLFDFKKDELNDKAIFDLLKGMPEMYENGELAEVGDICLQIYHAIQGFENQFYLNERRADG